MKKLAIVLGSLFALLLAAIVIIPLVVDVDKYRPQIVKVADDQLNGKLELGKLSLSLWGQVKIQIAGLQLSDNSGRVVVAVKDAGFHIPFTSLLSGAPTLDFHMDQPEITVIKNKAGKLNVMRLMKGDQFVGAEALKTPQNAPAKGASSGGNVALPAMVAAARLGVEIRNANLVYKDETTGLDTKLNDLNFVAKDISLSHPTEIQFWSDLNTTMGKTLSVRGPVKMTAEATPTLSSGKFDHASLTAKVNADDLEIASSGVFEKKKGMAANVDLAMTVSQREAKIEKLLAKFFNAEVNVSGSVANLTSGTEAPAVPVIRLAVKSNDIEFKPWVELVPMLKDYELGGSASLSANAEGPSDKLGYSADLKVIGLTAKAPKLKAQPRFDADIHVAPDKVDKLLLTMKAPGNDLKVTGTVVNFLAPHADITVSSTGMDLDQLVEFPPPGSKAAGGGAASGAGAASAAGGGAAPKADFDAMLAPIRANPMMKAMAANVNLNLKLLKAYNVKMTDLVGRAYFKDLGAGLDGFAMKLWDGTVKASASTNMAPAHPTYKFGAQVANLNLQQAVESQFAVFKNTVIGRATMDLSGEGVSYNPDAAMDDLKAKGTVKIAPAEFTTIDVGKMTVDAINESIGKLAAKVPALNGKHLNAPAGGKGTKYESVTSSVVIAGGKFSMPDFTAKAQQNQGIDLKGSTTVGMKDLSLNADWQVIDTYNVTHAKDISAPNPLGGNVEHILADKSGPVQFPVHVGGTCMAPQYSYTQVPEYLAKVALNNMAGGAKSAATAKAQQAVQQQVLKNAPPAVQNAAGGLVKKLFGH